MNFEPTCTAVMFISSMGFCRRSRKGRLLGQRAPLGGCCVVRPSAQRDLAALLHEIQLDRATHQLTPERGRRVRRANKRSCRLRTACCGRSRVARRSTDPPPRAASFLEVLPQRTPMLPMTRRAECDLASVSLRRSTCPISHPRMASSIWGVPREKPHEFLSYI